MKIITWNCCLPPWSLTRRKRLPEIVSNLLDTEADIICLQEIFFKKDADFIISKLKKLDFPYSFYFKDLLAISKFPLIKKQNLIFKSQGNVFSWAILDVLYKKGFQLIEIESDIEKFFLVNTHLLSACALDKPKHQIVRENQLEEIYQEIDKYYIKSVILGDLNFQPGTNPYQKIVKYGFCDPFDKNVKTVKNGRLDYIFLKNIDWSDAKALSSDDGSSDHVALSISVKR